jgi:uncharacterized membrane protein YGL010W
MSRLDALFARYGESHRHPANQAIHWICVPLITWSLLALLWWWTPVSAYALIALATAYYLTLSVPLAIGMLAVTALMIAPLTRLPSNLLLPLAIAVFVVAWVGQFVGHKIEGRRPSFFEDITYLLVGPLRLVSLVFRRFGIPY